MLPLETSPRYPPLEQLANRDLKTTTGGGHRHHPFPEPTDILVRRQTGHWRVELNPEIAPQLGINRQYAELIKHGDRDNRYLCNYLQETRGSIESLQSQNDNLLKVASAIVELSLIHI